jgi:type I restriction enzyme M protein
VDVSPLSEAEGYDLSVKNPDGGEVVVHRSPLDIMEEISRGDAESAEILARARELLSHRKGDN